MCDLGSSKPNGLIKHLSVDLTLLCCKLQGPLARGIKAGSSVRLAEGAKLKGGLAKIACKTRMGQDKAQAAQVTLIFLPVTATAMNALQTLRLFLELYCHH